MARRVIDHNRYLVLGTVEPDGRPRLSPVFYTPVDYRDFYWVSSPEAQHSHNVREQCRRTDRGVRLDASTRRR